VASTAVKLSRILYVCSVPRGHHVRIPRLEQDDLPCYMQLRLARNHIADGLVVARDQRFRGLRRSLVLPHPHCNVYARGKAEIVNGIDAISVK